MRQKAIAAVLIGGFFLLLAWVKLADVYNAHFFDHGILLTAYQFTRILYIPYLLWLQYAAGAGAVFLLGKRQWILAGRAHYLTCFLAGTSLWHMALFAAGLAGLYSYVPMLVLAGGVMLFSAAHMVRVVRIARLPQWNTADEKILGALAALAAVAFIFLRGTYPSGGHDFYNIYLPYFRAVLRDGHVGPNEVWYAYFYAKGVGLDFLSMILLDPLAVHVVTTSFIMAAACMVYDMLDKNRSKALPLLGVFCYFGFYIYTPGNGLFAFSGGWGDLEKTHELTAVFVLGVIWLAGKIFARTGECKTYGFVLALVAAASAIISVQIGLFLGLFLGLLMIYSWFSGRRDCAVIMLAGACACALAIAVVMVVNYLATGMLLEQWIIGTWPLLDWQKIVHWGPSLELYMRWNGFMLQQNHFDAAAFALMVFESLRLFLWGPLLVMGVWIAVRRKQTLPPVYSIFLLAALIAIAGGATGEPLSFFRFSTFTYAPVLIACLLLWQTISSRTLRNAGLFIAGGFALVMCFGAYLPGYFGNAQRDWQGMTLAALRFNSGYYSLRDATNDLSGRSKNLASKTPLQGTDPAFEAIYKQIPARTRIWNMDNIAYCMLPACNTQQQSSVILSPRWYDIATSGIDEGRKILQGEGLDYIFFSARMVDTPYADAKDLLSAIYPGLSPDNIAGVYGIAWSNGEDYLLTWKSADTQPLDAHFMELWTKYFEQSVAPRESYFSAVSLAPYIKEAVHNPNLAHPLPLE